MAEVSFLSSLTFWVLTCFFFLLWVPTRNITQSFMDSPTFASNLGIVVCKTFCQFCSGIFNFVFHLVLSIYVSIYNNKICNNYCTNMSFNKNKSNGVLGFW